MKSSLKLMVFVMLIAMLTSTIGLPAKVSFAQEDAVSGTSVYVADLRAVNNSWERLMFTSLQGIANQEGIRIFLIMENGDVQWLQWYVDQYGFEPQYVENPYDLFLEDWPVEGYVLVDSFVPDSANIAANYAASERLLPVTEPILGRAEMPDWEITRDLRGMFDDLSKTEVYEWAMEHQWPTANQGVVGVLNAPEPAIDISHLTQNTDTIYLKFEDATKQDPTGPWLQELNIAKGDATVFRMIPAQGDEAYLAFNSGSTVNGDGRRANGEDHWIYRIDGVQGADRIYATLFNQYRVSLATELEGSYEQIARNTMKHTRFELNNNHIRDYIIAQGGFFFDLSSDANYSAEEYALKDLIFSQMPPYSHVLGWHSKNGSEKLHVKQASEHDLLVMATTYTANFSVHEQIVPKSDFTQPQKVTPEEVELDSDKVYVTYIMSDGDSPNFVNGFMGGYWNQDGRGQIPMGWEMQPLLADIAPGIVEYYYQNATENDTFVLSASGNGYTYPDVMSEHQVRNLLVETKPYLSRLDLTTLVTLPYAEAYHGRVSEIYGEVLGDELHGIMNDYWGQRDGLETQRIIHGMAWLPTALPLISQLEQRTVDGFTAALQQMAERRKDGHLLFVPIHVPKGHMSMNDFRDITANLDPNLFKVVAPDEFMIAYKKADAAGVLTPIVEPELPSYHAAMASEPVSVDASATDAAWNEATRIDFDGYDEVTSQYGKTWNSVSFEAEARVMWDEEHLYFLANISDNERKIESDASKIYQNDAVGLFLYDEVNGISYKIFATPAGLGGTGPAMAGWGPLNNPPAHVPENVELAGRSDDNTYTVEMAIPWSDLSESFQPSGGENLKFSVMVFDADEAGWGQSMWVGQGDTPPTFASLVLGQSTGIRPEITIEGLAEDGSYTDSVTPTLKAEAGKVDLTPYTSAHDTIYVKFEDSTKEDGFGAQLGELKVLKNEEPIVHIQAGTSEEQQYLFSDDRTQVNAAGRRYANLDRSWVYKIDGVQGAEAMSMDLTNQYLVSIATEAAGPYVELGSTEATRYQSGIKSLTAKLDGLDWVPGQAITDSGPHTMVVTAVDNAGSKAAMRVHFTLYDSTTLYVEPAAGVYSDITTLQATLTDNTGQELVGEEVTFLVDGAVAGTAATGAEGIAVLPYPIEASADSNSTVQALVEQNDTQYYRSSTGSNMLAVGKELASIQYTGSLASSEDGMILLSAKVEQEQDGQLGSVDGLPVQFTLSQVQPDGTKTELVDTVTATVYETNDEGLASFYLTLPAGVYEVQSHLATNSFYESVDGAIHTITVVDGFTGSLRVNGWYALETSDTSMGSKVKKVHLNSEWSYDETGSLSGRLRIHATPQGMDLQVSTAEWMVLTEDAAYLQGTAMDTEGKAYVIRLMLQDDRISLLLWEGDDTPQAPLHMALDRSFSGSIMIRGGER